MSKIHRISQSSISAFYNPEVCDVAWLYRYVRGIETEPSLVQNKGLLFEYELIGGCRGGTRPELPKSVQKGKKFGTVLKDERDLLELVKESKLLLDAMGFKVVEVQPEWISGDLVAHLDAIAKYKGHRVIGDVKYTETEENDWRNGWGDLEAKSTIQPVHYTYMSKLVTGEYLPFYYWIFGKSGWVKFVEVKVMQAAIDEHEHRLREFREHIKTFKPIPANNYNTCRKCPFWDRCESKTTLPVIEQHEIDTLTLI